MALAAVTVPDSSFHWDIHHPFTPWRLSLAYFLHGSLNLSLWKVMIEPLKRRINSWTFQFHLEFEHNFAERREITANRVQVGIYLSNRRIAEKDVTNVLFSPRNFFTYQFRVHAIANVEQDQELLVVKIKLDLPGEAAENQSTVGVDADRRWLSEDLRRLLISEVHSDMQLRSKDDVIIKVHSCILDARWQNFFILHSLDDLMQVDVGISSYALWHILLYLYSGEVRFGWPHNENAQYITELFHVITRYELGHLFRVILKREMQQQIVLSNGSTITRNFTLCKMLGGGIISSMQTWCVNQNTPYEFIFKIRVQPYCGPWLSYSLRSKSGIKVYAQVNLDLRKKIIRNRGTDAHTYYEITHVHQCDYTIPPNGFEQSRNILFLGCPETFRYLNSVDRPDQRIEVWDSILCTLKFTDGRIIEQIHSRVIETAEQEERDRRNILGDHLFRLLCNPNRADLCILAPIENENQPDQYPVHKAIFAARVAHWWSVFQDAQERDGMPNVARSFLRSKALSFVLHYIYSGRTLPIPHDLLDDIQHFAETGESHSLFNYVMHIRYEHVNDWPDSE